MNAAIGWSLAVVATALASMLYGWRGALLALSVVVFWLLLQFARAARALRIASAGPIGRVPSAVQLHARLHDGMRLTEILSLTRSLGRKVDVSEGKDAFEWQDEAGHRVIVTLAKGRLSMRQLQRDPQATARLR
jgi:hypothetical protein